MGLTVAAVVPARPRLLEPLPAPSEAGWLALAAAASFATVLVFADLLALGRNPFVLAHTLVVGALAAGYVRRARIDISARLHRHWPLGLAASALGGAFLVHTVLVQPASETATGVRLVLELVWAGVAYGLADGVLLSVLPVVIVLRVLGAEPGRAPYVVRIGAGAAAVMASAALIMVYHLGFAELRNLNVLYPMAGVSLLSLLMVVTGSPLPALLGHVAMHVAAVLHGPAGLLQLPPH